ncbi:hypothetical protein CCR84_09985 [Rhodocyclus purpureus]|nr:hypothetical protein [Rhodocyclus purpureus]
MLARALNHDCPCPTLDLAQLPAAMAALLPGAVAEDELPRLLAQQPLLFSALCAHVGEADLERMQAAVGAIERVVANPAFQAAALARAPEIAQLPQRAAGVFFGYDFHLGEDGPRLIEINTNAGGGLLNALLAALPRTACAHVAPGAALEAAITAVNAQAAGLPERFIAMFREEWRLARGERPLVRVAIVDDVPDEQFLAAEFAVCRRLFASAGIDALIADPSELHFADGVLSCRGQRIDLVYNRLTDFDLSAPEHAALRAAYLADAVVLTPHPRAHALYADKRNLCLLSDGDWLAAAGVAPADRELLAAVVPRTLLVAPEDAETFWNERRRYFFKPFGGYAGRATYRGDKLTKRVFAEIAGGGYVAQELASPSSRRVLVDGEVRELKLDLRLYVYQGEVQLAAARLYQGQTTNFRTPGGGFAPVIALAGT